VWFWSASKILRLFRFFQNFEIFFTGIDVNASSTPRQRLVNASSALMKMRNALMKMGLIPLFGQRLVNASSTPRQRLVHASSSAAAASAR